MLSKLVKLSFPGASPVVYNNVPNPNFTVLILGWGGSKTKNLKKVADYYTSKNIQTYSFIMPLYIPLIVRRVLEENVVAVIASSPIHKSKFICHIYSNNGLWTYGSLIQRTDFPAVDRLVFDSAPYMVYEDIGIIKEARMLTRVITCNLLQTNVYHHPVISPIIFSGLTFIGIINRFSLIVQSNTGFPLVLDVLKLNVFLRDEAPLPPSLFVYSSGDQLIRPDDIIQFKDTVVSRGGKVDVLVLGDDVPHTGAFFLRTQEYIDKLESFTLQD